MDLGIVISMVLFYLSFSWVFSARTSRYPYLRRLTAIFSIKQHSVNSPHVRVMLWGFGYISFWIIMSSISFYMYMATVNGYQLLSLFVGPVLYFLAPQTISASTTLLIIWRVPDDPRLEDARLASLPSVTKYLSGKKARNFFIVAFFASLLLVYSTPAILWLVSLLQR